MPIITLEKKVVVIVGEKIGNHLEITDVGVANCIWRPDLGSDCSFYYRSLREDSFGEEKIGYDSGGNSFCEPVGDWSQDRSFIVNLENNKQKFKYFVCKDPFNEPLNRGKK